MLEIENYIPRILEDQINAYAKSPEIIAIMPIFKSMADIQGWLFL
jgi:hypothetical protein